MDRFSASLLRYRKLILLAAAVVTLIMGVFAWQVSFQTVYRDLLPAHDEFVLTHFQYEEQYGGPLSVRVVVEVLDGQTIYSETTLKKVKRITETLNHLPGVNPAQIYSIISGKVRRLEVDEEGVYSVPLVASSEPLPSSSEDLAVLKARIESTPGVVGQYVAWDGTAAYIQANLIEGRFDYPSVFEFLQARVKPEEDALHRIHLFGQPVLTGWVYRYKLETLTLFAISILVMLGLVYAFARSLRLVVVAGIATAISAIWGLGVVGIFGWGIDPLTAVIPMLIMARTLSHSVQLGTRYAELAASGLSPDESLHALVKYQFRPGVLGVVTDSLGIFAIAVADIPIIQKLAVFCGIWALSVIITVLVIGPVLLSFSKHVETVSVIPSAAPAWEIHLLQRLARIFFVHSYRVWVWGSVAIVLALSAWLSAGSMIGELAPGTSILWRDSEYNQAEKIYATRFQGPAELIAIYETPEGSTSRSVQTGLPTDIRSPKSLGHMLQLQEAMEADANVRGSISVADLIPEVRRAIGGNPKFGIVPYDPLDSVMLFELLQSGASAGDFDRYFNRRYADASVRFFASDLRSKTVEDLVSSLRQAVSAQGESTQDNGSQGRFKLAGGSVALAYATNQEVHKAQWLSLVLSTLIIAVACAVAYRSFVAAAILLVPLLLTDFVVAAIMATFEISFNVNTLPVVSVGMGVGIDYGIYLLSRIRDEVKEGTTLEAGVERAICTSGRAILFTGSVMIVAVMIWYAFSNLRFQADMGLLLMLIMFLNMAAALSLLPLQVLSFRPSFITRHGENNEALLNLG